MRITEIHSHGAIEVSLSLDGKVTLIVPIAVRHRSARKQVIGPIPKAGGDVPISLTPFQLALVKGHRWLTMLETGTAISMKDIAAREQVDPSLVSRLINLTTLTPDVVNAILEGTLQREFTLLDVAMDLPLYWGEQLAPS